MSSIDSQINLLSTDNNNSKVGYICIAILIVIKFIQIVIVHCNCEWILYLISENALVGYVMMYIHAIHGFAHAIPLFIFSEKIVHYYYKTFSSTLLLDLLAADCHIFIMLIVILIRLYHAINFFAIKYDYSSIEQVFEQIKSENEPTDGKCTASCFIQIIYHIAFIVAFLITYCECLVDTFKIRFNLKHRYCKNQIEMVQCLVSDKLKQMNDLQIIIMDLVDIKHFYQFYKRQRLQMDQKWMFLTLLGLIFAIFVAFVVNEEKKLIIFHAAVCILCHNFPITCGWIAVLFYLMHIALWLICASFFVLFLLLKRRTNEILELWEDIMKYARTEFQFFWDGKYYFIVFIYGNVLAYFCCYNIMAISALFGVIFWIVYKIITFRHNKRVELSAL
eukprot:264540_1